jgi:hypothetical protein
MAIVWPIGSSSGQNRFAIVSLISATGGDASVSTSVNSRPRTTATCSTLK